MVMIPTGFGDVRFTFNLDNSIEEGAFPDWDIPLNVVEQPIPGGGGRVIVQVMGNGLAKVTWRVRLANQDDYSQLVGYLGTKHTLTVFHDSQTLKDEIKTHFGEPYETLRNVLLRSVSQADHIIGGERECSVTFWRAVNLATLGSDV